MSLIPFRNRAVLIGSIFAVLTACDGTPSAADRARDAGQHSAAAKANHERHLSWQKAHPIEYAAQRRKVRAEAVARAERAHVEAARIAAHTRIVADNGASFWETERQACQDIEIMIHRAAASITDGVRDDTANNNLNSQSLADAEHVYVMGHDRYDCTMSDGSNDHHQALDLAEIRRAGGQHGYTYDDSLK